MKRITLILSLILSILFPTQAQDYIYKKDAEPIKTTFDRLYLKEIDNNYYITENTEFEFDTIAGVFRVCAVNAFYGNQEEWTLTVTRDEVDENKIWLQPIITVNGLDADDVKPVYAWVDTVAGNIQLPYGQTIYGGPNEFMNLVIAGLNEGPDLTGAAVCNYVLDDRSVSFTIPFLGAGDTSADAWWYAAFKNITVTWTDVLVSEPESVIPLTEIDSISKVAPKIRLLNYEKSQNDFYFNMLFNYSLLSYQPYHEIYASQGWFNETISYKAYDSDNNIVKEDFVEIFLINGNSVDICLHKHDWTEGDTGAQYELEGILPCDTAFQVAFTISPEALVWAGDTKIAYEGIESYIDEQGQRHGIVIDYYNERPRLLSTSPLSFNPANPYQAYLQFSENVQIIADNPYSQEVTLSVYRKDGNSGKYSIINTTTDYYLFPDFAENATIQVPDYQTLQDGDIVTVSWDNWRVCDWDFCRAEPFSMESGVDAEGNPYGLWWMVRVSAPSIESRSKTLSYNRDDREIKVKFDTPIFRTDEMPPVTFEVFNENREMYASGDFIARAEDRILYLTLPEDVVLNENEKSTILLNFPKGAVESAYGTQMLPIDCDWDENGNPTGYYAVVDMSAENSFFREGAYLFNYRPNDIYGPAFSWVSSVPIDFSLIASDVDLSARGIANPATQWSISGLLSGMSGNYLTETPVSAYSYWNNNGAEEIVMIDFDDAYGGACLGTIDLDKDDVSTQYPVYFCEVYDGIVNLACSFTVDGDEAIYSREGILYLCYLMDGEPLALMEIKELSITQSGEFKAAKVKVFDEPMKLDAPLELGTLKKMNFKQ